MAALWNRPGHYIFVPCFFFYFSIFLFSLAYSQPSQIGCPPYFHTWCGLSANLRCRSETCCTRLAENTGRKKLPKICHLGTIAQLCRAISSQLRHVSTIGKKLVKQQYPHTFSQYGELWPTSGWDWFISLGHPANLNGFHVLAALLHGTLVVGVSQTLRHWDEGATDMRQGDHHVGHWPTF